MSDVFAGIVGWVLIVSSAYLCTKCVCSPHLPVNNEGTYVVITQAQYDHLQERANEKQALITAPPAYTLQPTTIQAPTVQAPTVQAPTVQAPTVQVQQPLAQQAPTV
jgi:hypothetical protein